MLKQYQIKYYYPSGARSKVIVNANSPAEAVQNFYMTHSVWYVIRHVKEIHARTEAEREYFSNIRDGIMMTLLFEIMVAIFGFMLWCAIFG